MPAAVAAVLAGLAGEGHRAVLVGGCVRDLHLGRRVHDFDVATSASPDVVLELFPRAVPIGLRHGTVMVPTAVGPVDVTTFRAAGTLDSDLAHRDFTCNAMALEPDTGRWHDPEGGRADLARGVLRAVGTADARLAEDPLRALRAVRLVAELGLRPDAALREALARRARSLEAVAAERIRQELERLLLGPHVQAALALLRETGLEAALAPGVREDAARVTARMPAEPSGRLAAWLRGTAAGTILRRLRFPRSRVSLVEALVAAHPIDRGGLGLASLRRRHRRLGDEGLDTLVALRRAELEASPRDDAPARARLAAVEEALAALRARGTLSLGRSELAVDGARVMEWLGCGPGPRVGRALRWLTERVAEDPARNEPETLRALLADWSGEP